MAYCGPKSTSTELGWPSLCRELIWPAEQVAFAMPSQLFGPRPGLAWTVPSGLLGHWTQEGSPCPY